MKKQDKITNWFKTEQIETYVGQSNNGDDNVKITGGRSKLIVMHQCGKNKEWLIGQLKTMIHGLENNFDYFAK